MSKEDEVLTLDMVDKAVEIMKTKKHCPDILVCKKCNKAYYRIYLGNVSSDTIIDKDECDHEFGP